MGSRNSIAGGSSVFSSRSACFAAAQGHAGRRGLVGHSFGEAQHVRERERLVPELGREVLVGVQRGDDRSDFPDGHPQLAQVAIQQGKVTARNIQRIINGKRPKPFHYKDSGLLATIGRNAAVARIWGLSFSGFIAWVIWVFLHIYRLIGFRNRLLVFVNWAWDYLFRENQVRLISKE